MVNPILSAADVAAQLGVSSRSVTRAAVRAAEAGMVAGRMVGRAWCFTPADVDRLRPFVVGVRGNPQFRDAAMQRKRHRKALAARRRNAKSRRQ